MQYHKGLIASYFIRENTGKYIFYPWGVFGKGYIIIDESVKKKIEKILTIYAYSTPLIIGLTVVGILSGLYYFFFLIVLPVIVYVCIFKYLTYKLTESGINLKFNHAFLNSAKAHNPNTLWALFICSLVFVFMSILLIAIGDSDWRLCLGGGIFFALCGIVFYKMIKINAKDSGKESKK